MGDWYKADLAYIHDIGYGDFADQAAVEILVCFQAHQIESGLVVDLGCGSGIWADHLVQAGYQVVGIDISEAMIELARNRVPTAEFRVESLFTASLPTCQAVTALGEGLNYLFDAEHNSSRLGPIFQRIFDALEPGGLFLFDLVESGQVAVGQTSQGFREGDDWMVLVEKQEDLEKMILTRRIITFRQEGSLYRRDEEIHRQQLYNAEEIAEQLSQIGFQVQISNAYGEYELAIARKAITARKP